jgi:hypothetical protein
MNTFFTVVATVLVMVGVILLWGLAAGAGVCVLLGLAVGARGACRTVQRRRGPAPSRPAGPHRPPSYPPLIRRRRHGRACWLLRRRPALVLVDHCPDVAEPRPITIPPMPDRPPPTRLLCDVDTQPIPAAQERAA